MSALDVPVLIVGGSLVGVSAALFLAQHGIAALAVEHHRGTAIHPRAAQISQRTMELLRSVGLEARVRERSSEQFAQDGAIVEVETLAGEETASYTADLNEGIRGVSPCERVFISQSLLEPLLGARAEALGAHLRFGTDLISFDQDGDGVTATIAGRDTGTTETVRASYLVAADGAQSTIREKLGIPMRGHGVLSRSVTIYFRADLLPLLRDRNLSIVYVNHPRLRGFFRFEKPFDRGFLAVTALGDPAAPITDVATKLTEQRAIDLVRTALGADVPITIEHVMTWNAAADWARRYDQGRVFLAGDAAHVMPPDGGFGGNTGVQDAHNLAWKLAMVLRGEAEPALLATYGAERAPVGELTAEQAFARFVARTAPHLDGDRVQPLVPDLNVELGYRYDSAAIAGEEGEAPLHDDPRAWQGRPGTRAPHVWLERAGRRISTLDLFGRRFVLAAGPDALSWYDSAAAVAAELPIPIDLHRIGADGLDDPDGSFCTAFGIPPRGIVLVRPDGFVAWRSKTLTGSPSAVAAAIAQAACRDTIVSGA